MTDFDKIFSEKTAPIATLKDLKTQWAGARRR
jgi:hypothetical protein